MWKRAEFMENYLTKFDEFYKSDLRNTHVQLFPINIYTRKSYRCFKDTEQIPCIDIASVTVEPEYQKRKLFTDLLGRLIEKYPNENIFIESIQNESVKRVAIKYGFKIKQDNPYMDVGYSMYLIR